MQNGKDESWHFEKLKGIVSSSSNIVFFGGAGVSTESGIPDFRSSSGLYSTGNIHNYPPEVMLSHSFFIKHTQEFYDFYRTKMIYTGVKPNDAHIALAELEKRGRLKAVVTQNIDSLHQMAGSKNVLELHGSISRNYCMDCGRKFDLDYILKTTPSIPRCDKCGGIVKPDVVLYEEMLDNEVLDRAVSFISAAEVLIVGGSSLVVNPAASLVNYYRGRNLILINKSETPYDRNADIVIHDSVGKVLRKVLLSFPQD